MYYNCGQFRSLLYLLIILITSLACGNLLNEELATSPASTEKPDLVNKIDTVFNKKLSTSAAINIQTDNDEYVISGSSINENNIDNIWLASLDKSGNILFDSTFKSVNHVRIAAQLTTYDNNFLFVCNEFNPVTYKADILLLMISPDKQIKWHMRLGSETSTFALAAVLLSNGTIAVTAQAENYSTSNYEPILIKVNPDTNSVVSLKLDFQVSFGNKIYPIPVKIICDKTNSLTIAGYYLSLQKSRIAVVKIDAENNITSRYMLYEPDKNLDILDILYQNSVYDILLVCKSDKMRGRDEGFTLLKIFKDSSIKFERDYLINGFTISDNIIKGESENFAVGGFITNDISDHAISLIRFNYSGNIMNYYSIETNIPEISRIVFSPAQKSYYISYIYTGKKITEYADIGLFAKRLLLTENNKSSNVFSDKLKTAVLNDETLYPVEIIDLIVTIANTNDITIKPVSELNIVWD